MPILAAARPPAASLPVPSNQKIRRGAVSRQGHKLRSELHAEAAIRERLDRLLQHHFSPQHPVRKVKYFGLDLRIPRGVFCPDFGEGSRLLGLLITDLDGLSFLDMGTGSGALGLLAARAGAARVVSTDICELSAKCARDNVSASSYSDRIEVYEGDLFEPLSEQDEFDVISFNPPFMKASDHYGLDFRTPEEKNLQRAIFDDGCVLERFLSQAQSYLRKDGRILLAYSDMVENTHLHCQISKAAFAPRLVAEDVSDLAFFVLELRRKS